MVEASATACSNVDSDPALSLVNFNVKATADAVYIVVNQTYVAPTPKPTEAAPPQTAKQSAAVRFNASPLVTLMGLSLAFVFVFPKQRFSVFVVFAVLALAFWTPIIKADEEASSTITITLNIGIPPAITNTCNDNQCVQTGFPYVVALGKAYSTLDQVGSCSAGNPMNLPTGWTVSSPTDEAKLVILLNTWTATAIFLSDNNAYLNNQYAQSTSGATMTNSGNGVYKVSDCSYKILIESTLAIVSATNVLIGAPNITNVQTIEGKDYGVADNAAFGTTTKTSQANAVYISSTETWQVASLVGGTAQIAFHSETASFGADCFAVQSSAAGVTPVVYTSYNFATMASCGTSDVVAQAYNGGMIYSIARGSTNKVKILFGRANPNPAFALDSYNSYPVMKNTLTVGSDLFVLMDNAPINGGSPADSGCQNRWFTVPTGYSFATNDQLSTFIANVGNNWPTTQCFSNHNVSVSRDGTTSGCAGSNTYSSGADKYFYGNSACARTVLHRSAKSAGGYTLGMKVLVITSDRADPAVDLVKNLTITMLTARDMPYDWLVSKDTSGNPISTLGLMTGSTANYYAIVFTSSATDSFGGPITAGGNTLALWNEFNNYKYNFNIRVVMLSASPAIAQGLTNIYATLSPNNQGRNFNYNKGYLTSDFIAVAGDALDGINSAGLYDMGGPQVVNGQNVLGNYYVAVNPGQNGMPLLRITADNSTVKNPANDLILACLVTNTDTTEEIQFYTGQSAGSYVGPVLSHVWMDWMTRGVYIGWRRVYFSPQIDDMLLATEQYQNANDVQRMTGADLAAQAQFCQDLTNKLPKGSYVTLTFGVNGSGQKNLTDGAPALNVSATAGHDELADAIQTYYDDFFWESHTFCHRDMTCQPETNIEAPHTSCATPTDKSIVEADLSVNNVYMDTMLFAPFGGLDAERVSKNSMITPAITGLFNAHAIQALLEYNYTCVVGDNSRPDLRMPGMNPYNGWWTTAANPPYGNTWAGLFILPRWPTEVYFNAYNQFYAEKEYNTFYNSYYGYNSNLDQIMEREADHNFLHMAELRHDPFMFHQCNNIHWQYTYPGDAAPGSWSLVSMWLRAVTERYMQFMDLPLITVKQQDLRDVYWARIDRAKCNIAGTITIDGSGNVSGVTVSGNYTCLPLVTGDGVNCPSGLSGCKLDQYGDPSNPTDTTVHLPITPGVPVTVPISNTKWEL